MKPLVVDTGVASFIFRRHPLAERYEPHLHNRELLISFMTEAELEQWVLVANWGPKRVEWLRVYSERFIVVPSSRSLATRWAEAEWRRGVPVGESKSPTRG